MCFDKIHIQGIINCEHVFCFDCIHNWSLETNACPICRNPFRMIKKVGNGVSEFIKIEEKKDDNEDSDIDPIFFGILISK